LLPVSINISHIDYNILKSLGISYTQKDTGIRNSKRHGGKVQGESGVYGVERIQVPASPTARQYRSGTKR
jgi:hypothetical protein